MCVGVGLSLARSRSLSISSLSPSLPPSLLSLSLSLAPSLLSLSLSLALAWWLPYSLAHSSTHCHTPAPLGHFAANDAHAARVRGKACDPGQSGPRRKPFCPQRRRCKPHTGRHSEGLDARGRPREMQVHVSRSGTPDATTVQARRARIDLVTLKPQTSEPVCLQCKDKQRQKEQAFSDPPVHVLLIHCCS